MKKIIFYLLLFVRFNKFLSFIKINKKEIITFMFHRINNEKDVLWPNTPIYFCKTSGTTSGTKYIPISKESLSNHITGARDSILNYISNHL